MTRSQKIILADIICERQRQDKLVASGELPFNCADEEIDDAEKARVLGEEYGEVCKASYELDHGWRGNSTSDWEARRAKQKAHLRTELLQLAAVCVAWAESL